MDFRKMRADVEVMRASGHSLDDILEKLRQRGCGKAECYVILRSVLPLDSDVDIQKLLHFSPVFAEQRQADEELQDQFFDALESTSD